MAGAQANSAAKFKRLFDRIGKLNLLDNYRGERRSNRSVIVETLKFAAVILFWVCASYGAGVALPLAVMFAAAWVTSYIDPWFGELPLGDAISQFAPIATVLAFVPVNAMFVVLLERKLLASLTTRLGPNRVGFNGMFQTFADALKLLFKEDTTPNSSDKLLFFLAPAVFFAPSVIAFLPLLGVAGASLGPFAGGEFATSLLFVFSVSSVAVMGLVMAGWSSNNKYSLIGGLRSAAQAISYEIPLILCLAAMVVLVGSVDLAEIGRQQAQGLFDWHIFGAGALEELKDSMQIVISGNFVQGTLQSVFAIVQLLMVPVLAFTIYLCTLAEVNRIPFDMPEAESELVSGYNTEFSGMKFALFFLAEYTNLFIVSAVLAIVFFGGTSSGIPLCDEYLRKSFTAILPIGDLSWMPGAFMLLVKTYLFIVVAIWIRATLPRLRSDQLMGLSWKILIPLSLLAVVFAGICRTFVYVEH